MYYAENVLRFRVRVREQVSGDLESATCVGSLRTACSLKDYCSPVPCLGAKQGTLSPSSVAFYDSPGKDWAVCIFFVPVHTRGAAKCVLSTLL